MPVNETIRFPHWYNSHQRRVGREGGRGGGGGGEGGGRDWGGGRISQDKILNFQFLF